MVGRLRRRAGIRLGRGARNWLRRLRRLRPRNRAIKRGNDDGVAGPTRGNPHHDDRNDSLDLVEVIIVRPGDDNDNGGNEIEGPKAADDERKRERLRRSVMSAFFKDGKLVSIPAKHSKRLVVLERLLAEFTEKDSYHEREINDVLRRFHEDVCTLRREFIMHCYMTRKDGYYRLTAKGRRAVA